MSPRRFAILVGVNQYENCGILNFSVQDIEAIRKLLLDPARGGYSPEYLKTVSDDESTKPLKVQIIRTIRNVSSAATSADDILLYFSGHGLTNGGTAYLVPTEGSSQDPIDSCISLDWLSEELQRSKATRKIMILDACHSGLEMGKPATGAMTKGFEAALQKISQAEGFAVLSSCKADELSAEDPALQHGVFSHYLHEGMVGPADSDGDYNISVLEAYQYASNRVQDWAIRKNTRQTPTLLAKVAGDIVLVKVPKPMKTQGGGSAPTIKTLFLIKNTGRHYYKGRDYSEVKEQAAQNCLGAISSLGAIIARIYGPEDINLIDTFTRSYRGGTIQASMQDSNSGFDCFLKVEADPSNEKFFTELVNDQGFSSIEYLISSPINLPKLHGVATSLKMSVLGYDPPRLFKAATASPVHLRMTVENGPSESKIRVDLTQFQYITSPTSETVEAAKPAKILELLQATVG